MVDAWGKPGEASMPIRKLARPRGLREPPAGPAARQRLAVSIERGVTSGFECIEPGLRHFPKEVFCD